MTDLKIKKAQCRHCTYYRSGEHLVKENYTGVEISYDGYCCFRYGFTYGVLVLVDANSCCNKFHERGD